MLALDYGLHGASYTQANTGGELEVKLKDQTKQTSEVISLKHVKFREKENKQH